MNASETRRLRHKSPRDLHCVTFGWAFMAVKTRAKRLNYGRNHLPTKLPYNSNIYICVVLFTFKVFENCVAYNNNNNEGGAPQFYWCNFCGFCIILELFVTWIISAMDDEILLQFTVKFFSLVASSILWFKFFFESDRKKSKIENNLFKRNISLVREITRVYFL